MESPRSGYISYAFSFYCLFILFITNTFPCLCASSSFAHLSSVLVESHSSASVLRESLQLLFFLDVSMHLHFIKQSGYPKLFELTWISKLPWSYNLFSERKITGMWILEMVFKTYVEPFETISGCIKFKIGKGKKTPYLHREVIRKCPKTPP